SYAIEHNWTTPSKAIMGGTDFIRHQYFENEQITLYQMRWNPKNPGSHQYASDIEWADKIADNMKKDYERLGIKKDKIRRNYYISNK
ncbi:MAG: autolysin, partial [Staphylococcus hominis]